MKTEGKVTAIAEANIAAGEKRQALLMRVIIS